MNHQPEILVVGGGAIGMTAALELADRGHHIGLLEKNEVGQASSWAGAGLLFCFLSAPDPALHLLIQQSVALFPDFCAALKARTSIDPEYYVSGALSYNTPFPTIPGHAVTQIERSAAEVRARFPLLNVTAEKVYEDPKRAQVRNSRLIQALKKAIMLHPRITLCEHTAVLSFETKGDCITALITSQGKKTAENILVTAGAWSSELLKNLGFQKEIFPVRGQLLAFDCGAPVNIPIVVEGEHYLVPRRDGVVLVGATMEYVGFDQIPTRAAFDALAAAAFTLMPSLRTMPLIAQWAGLRPGSHAVLPLIDRVPQYSNLWISGGHFRNGLVLAPISAKIIADLIEQKA